MSEVHLGKLHHIRKQMRTGHQAGSCKYSYVFHLHNGELVFLISEKDLGLEIGDERLLRVKEFSWGGSIATFENNPLWMHT